MSDAMLGATLLAAWMFFVVGFGGLGFRVQGLGFRVQVQGLGVPKPPK